MDSSLFKNSENFPDGALYRAKIQIFSNVDFNFRAQASIWLSRQYSSILTLVKFRFC
jgi:hypothetical protein